MATKKRNSPLLKDSGIDWNSPVGEPILTAPAQPAAEDAPPDGAMRRYVGDTALSVGRGAVQGVRMLTDIAGADNAVSGGLRSVEGFIGGLQSATAKRDQAEIARLLAEAEGKGVLDQVVAGLKAFGTAPLQTMAQAAGTSLPTIAAALIPGAGPVAMATRFAAPLALGAAQGAGAVKSSIYDEVKQRALKEGRTPAEAEQLAAQAQSYGGDNAGQIALGAGLGAWAGKSGLEGAAQRLIHGGGGQAASGMASRVAMGALAEGIPEAAQGGQEKFASNSALNNAGFPTDPMSGVIANATMEGLAGHAMGGAMGIPRPGDAIRETMLPEGGPMTRAANAATKAQARAADAGMAPLKFTPTELPAGESGELKLSDKPDDTALDFEADPRFAGAKTFDNGAAPNQPMFASKTLADIHIGEQGAMGELEAVEAAPGQWTVKQTDEAANRLARANIEQWMAKAQPMPEERARSMAKDADSQLGKKMTALPMPDGSGWTVVPTQWVSAPILMDYVEHAAAAEHANALREALAKEAGESAVVRAPRTPSANAVEIDPKAPNAVAQFIAAQAATNTMSARAFVQDYRAGRITDADVLERINPKKASEPSADERIAAAAAQAPKPAPTDGLILNPNGEPFKTELAANRAQKKAGTGAVLQVAGGWVVRPGATTVEPSNAQDQATRVPPAAAPAPVQEGADSAGPGTPAAPAAGAAGPTGATAPAVEGAGLKEQPSPVTEAIQRAKRRLRDVRSKLATTGVRQEVQSLKDQEASIEREIRDLRSRAFDDEAPTPDGQAAPAQKKPPFVSKEDGEHLFGIPQKRAKALERIAKGSAYFGAKDKATDFITGNGLKETHEAFEAKPGRFEVRAKGGQQAAPENAIDRRNRLKAERAAPQVESVTTPEPSETVSQNTIAARTLLAEYTAAMKAGAGEKGIAVLRRRAEKLAAHTSPSDDAAVLALDMLATRMGIERKGLPAGFTLADAPTQAAEPDTTPAATKGTADKPGPAKPQAAPSANTIFTEDAAAAARARLKAKLGRLNSGLDPETMMDGITLAGYHIEKGARKFAAFARAMVDDLGDGVKPYLQSWYMAVRGDPRAADMRADMDKASAVEDLDVDEVLAAEKPAAAPVEAAPTAPVADAATLRATLRQAIADGKMPKDNPALRKLVEAFDGAPPSQARMKVAQEDLEAAIVDASRDVVAKKEGDRSTFDILKRMYDSQPNLNIRTSDSIERQAYSTPAPLAYLGARLADITQATTVYEPTAGNGMLTITAKPANVTATELDAQRAESLRAQGIDVTQGDALTVEVAAKSKDRVITNPPFGPIKNDKGESIKVKYDGYTLGQIDHLIAARALEAMKDEGKAVLIIGANKATGQQSNNDLIFFNWLYGSYNVTSHFEVEGDLYQRQGAGWPVRVITIQGRFKSKTTAPAPATIQRANTWSEVYEQFQQGMGAGRPAVSTGARPVRGGAGQANDARAVPGAASAETGRADSGRPEGGPAGDADVAGERAGAVGNSAAVPGAAVGERSDAVGSNDQAPGPVDDAGVTVSKEAAKPAGNSGTAGVASADPDNQFQTKYIARSARKDEGVLIPVNMAGPTQDALNRLEDEVGDIDQFAANELGYASVADLHRAFMGLQVDSVASAISQIKAGKGIIIADQTGIGKGRQAAGVIRWAARNGKTPIFVTVKPALFTDMYGDLHDIGTDDISPLLMNVGESIKGLEDERLFSNQPALHKRALESIASTGRLPGGRNALFMTYSQISTDNVQRRAVMALAPNAVFVLDESHNAGGASATGDFIKGALDLASGVTYLSATYAKRPDNMPVYFKTDIGEAAADDNTLMSAMAAGGLPLQTVVSNNLVKAGQMFRRERSYDGVSIESRADTTHKAEHVALSDETTLALRAIVSADRTFHHAYVKALQEELAKEGSRVLDMAGNQAQQSVDHTQFSSVVHNFVRQMLLGLKAQEAANDAIRSIKRGEKPLIAVEGTMGSFLAEYAENNNLKVGDPLGSFDYRTVLSRALERSRYIVRQLPNGDKVKQYIPLSKLDPLSLEAYTKAQAIINKLKITIPVSPIDWMRDQITKAGYTVAEVTGRNLSVDYSDPKNPKLDQLDPREQKDKVRTTRMFNDGSLDAIILSVAGSTGISLHASEKFKDQRQRHMIVAQAAQDINIFMQMLGRVHRTGQVVLPKYTLLSADLPAEIRPTALLSGKMKSLNANTSSNTESATSVKAADMLNKYGDQIVGQYLSDNTELAQALDLTVASAVGDDPSAADDGIARKATGRLALMPVKVQEQFYAEVEEQYQALIDYLNKTNQNDLEPRTFDFDAQETKSAVLFEGQNKASPFGEDALYGEYSVKAQGKAMAPDEIRATMDEHLAGQKPAEHVKALVAPLQASFMKIRDGLADDEQKGKADTIARTGAAFFDAHKIGDMFRVDISGESYNAIVTNVRSTHKATGNPFSLSKIQVTIAVNGALRTVTLPATQFGKIEVSRINGGFGATIDAAFRVGPLNERETAKIVTGNLLGAYGEIEGVRGSIITFSKADGSTEQGILLPKAFNFTKDVRQDYRLKTGADVFKFLTTSTNENIERFGINSRDQVVRVLPAGRNGVTIQVPKSKAKGGKYFLDKALRDAAGDFVSSGNFMRATVYGDASATKALDSLLQKGALYALPSMADEARGILGDPATPAAPASPAFSRATGQRQQPASDRRQAVEALVKQIASRWGNAPVVVVVDSMEDERVPKAVRDYEKVQQSKGASGAPEGFFFGGKVYLVAGQLGGDADVLRVLFHEFGHAGLRTLFGPQLSTILTRLAVLNASKVRSKAAQYGLDYDKPADRRAAAEEVLAEMAERNPTNGWVKQAVAAIRSFLRAHVPGFSKMRLSDAELVRTFVRPALDYVAGNPAMPVKTNRAQFLVDKGGADAKPFADGGIAEVLVEQGAQALNIDQRLEVMARVFGALQDLKVFEAVVGLDSVDVVNDIIDAKLTASGGRDNHAMLLERLAVKLNGPIADQVKVIDALFPAVQRAAKKLAPAEAGADGFFGVISAATTGAYKQLAADAAGKLNGRHVVTPTSDGLLGDGVASTASSPPSVSADAVEKDSAAFSRSIGDAVGSIADKFNKGPAIVGQTGRQYTPAQLAAMTNVGFQTEPQTIQERAKSLWAGAGKTLAQGLVDQFAPVKAISEKAYGLLRLSKGASGAFEALLQGGKLKISDGVYDFDATQRGGVVDTLFKPLNGEHHDFLRWVAANRADRLMGVGKENLFTPEDIASLKSLADGATDFDYTIQHGARAGQVTRERTAIYADSLKTFNAFSANVLDMAEQSGLIDGEARGLWENEFYVPFYRVEEDGNIAGANIKNGAVRQQAFRGLTGRKNKLNADLLDNTLMNWAHLLDAGAKNRAAKASIEAAEKMGAAELVGGPSGKGTVWFRENGEKRYSFVSDPHLLTAISALEYAGMRNPVMNAMGAFKRALTIGVTASPFFKIRNLIRDSVQAIGTGNLSYNIAANVAQGWKLTDPTGDSHFRLLAGGGTIHFGTMMEGNEAKRVQALVESGVDAAHILDSDHKVKAFYRKFIEPGITAYNELGNRGEEINRASLYDQLMKQGMSHAEASLQARDLMDFSMQGSFTSIRFLTQVVPFLNARIQGLYKLGRAAKEDPARFSAVLGAVTLMSLALLAAYSDDDDWKKREDWDRNNFWWFKIAGTAVRIPKPFEIGAIATLAERGFELAFDKEMTGARFRKQVLTLLGDNLSMNPIPQLVKPILDVYANKNSFTGRPIETMGMEKLKPAYRVTERTTMAAKGISAAANVVTGLVGAEAYSPVQVDSLLQGYFGWLGSFIVGGGDVVARIVSDQPAKATPDYWKAATGGIISSLQDAPSRYVSQMYEQASEVEKAYGTWQMLRKQGRTDEAAEFQAENKDDINRHRELSRVKQTETRLNARIRSIQMSDRPADEKRDLIRSIQSQKDQIARALAPAG